MSTVGVLAIVFGSLLAVCCVAGVIGTLVNGKGKTPTNSTADTKPADPPVVAATTTAPPAVATTSPPPPAAPAGPATTFTDGTYEVGKEIKAGTYTCVADKGSPGYWQRARNAEGDLSSIIANDLVTEGAQAIVTVKAKEFFKVERLNCKIR